MDTSIWLVTSASNILERKRSNFLPIACSPLGQIKVKGISLKLIGKVIPDLPYYLFLYSTFALFG